MTLSADDLDLVRRVVADRSAIQLETGKEYLIESRLEALARTEQLDDATAVVATMRRNPLGPMTAKVVEAMTTNETSFFRDRTPFDALADVVLPQLISLRAPQKRLSIWCGAASTGQEPYSIAMTIRDRFPELLNWNVQIVATDLSTEVLDKARTGKYSQLEVNRGLPAPMLMKYFERAGAKWAIRPEIRQMVEFKELNLIGNWPALPRPDIVFLRNVMIYFDVPSRQRILAKISSVMARDGFLFLGAGESTINVDNGFQRTDLGSSGCFQLTSGTRATSPLATTAPNSPAGIPTGPSSPSNPSGQSTQSTPTTTRTVPIL